jgi:hypothetical protein
MAELKVWDTDPAIYLFTSLTAGSSHIITATSRMETILKATNESAKKLFQRRASGKKLPFIVKEGYVLGVCARRGLCVATRTNRQTGHRGD